MLARIWTTSIGYILGTSYKRHVSKLGEKFKSGKTSP
jgi:hypothetical protein